MFLTMLVIVSVSQFSHFHFLSFTFLLFSQFHITILHLWILFDQRILFDQVVKAFWLLFLWYVWHPKLLPFLQELVICDITYLSGVFSPFLGKFPSFLPLLHLLSFIPYIFYIYNFSYPFSYLIFMDGIWNPAEWFLILLHTSYKNCSFTWLHFVFILSSLLHEIFFSFTWEI